MEARAREALRDVLGDTCVEHDPIELEGAKLEATLRPANGAALAAALRVLGEQGLAALVRGGGTRLGFGNLPRRADVLLSTQALAGVVELDVDEGVLCARAGTPLATLRTALDGSGWELPFDPPGAAATLGGALAAGALGLRHARHGRPRDAVLGLEVTLGDGVRTRCGGRVVKNVTGYDLAKLHVGALGAFGVIEAAWVRLRPALEAVRVLSAVAGDPGAAVALGRRAARLPTVRVAALVDADRAAALEPSVSADGGLLLLVELAGDAACVEQDAAKLADATAVRDASPGALERLRALAGDRFAATRMRFRLAVPPSGLDAVVRALVDADAGLCAHPASGLVQASFAVGHERDERRADAAWRVVRRAAEAGGARVALEAGPVWARLGRDVFGDDPGAVATLRALKREFDPHGVLAPGRGPGGV